MLTIRYSYIVSKYRSVPGGTGALCSHVMYEKLSGCDITRCIFKFTKQLTLLLGVFRVGTEPPVACCPVFGWERVNFPRKLGGATARTVDPNWPSKRDIPYPVTSCSLYSWRAGWGRVIAAREQAGHRAVRKLHYVSLALYVLFTSIVIFLFLCGSVKLSLSQPMSFASFFQFSP